MTDPKLSRRKALALGTLNLAAIPIAATAVPLSCEPTPAAQSGKGRGKGRYAGLILATWSMTDPDWRPFTRCLMRLSDWAALPDGDRPEACVSQERSMVFFDVPGEARR